jgi:hypothetical protein
LLHIHLSLLWEVCDSSYQAACDHPHCSQLWAFSLTWLLASLWVKYYLHLINDKFFKAPHHAP